MLLICCYCDIKLSNAKNSPERLSKISLFIEQYDWKEIDFPSHQKDWEKSELNNKSIALNVLYVPYKTEKIRHEYKSKSNTSRENQVFLSLITHGKNGIILK